MILFHSDVLYSSNVRYSSFCLCIILFMLIVYSFFFVFKRKTEYEFRISDWSSDVCSSDLCADFAHVRELDAAELAVVVDVGLVEAFAAALFHARLEVGAVDIAVLVEVHLREALGELRLGGRFGLADAAVLVDVEFHHDVAEMAAVVRAVAMTQLVARQPAVLVLFGLVELLRQPREGGRF